MIKGFDSFAHHFVLTPDISYHKAKMSEAVGNRSWMNWVIEEIEKMVWLGKAVYNIVVRMLLLL
mgnify:FL=1